MKTFTSLIQLQLKAQSLREMQVLRALQSLQLPAKLLPQYPKLLSKTRILSQSLLKKIQIAPLATLLRHHLYQQ